jgi:hypothetical protein
MASPDRTPPVGRRRDAGPVGLARSVAWVAALCVVVLGTGWVLALAVAAAGRWLG